MGVRTVLPLLALCCCVAVVVTQGMCTSWDSNKHFYTLGLDVLLFSSFGCLAKLFPSEATLRPWLS